MQDIINKCARILQEQIDKEVIEHIRKVAMQNLTEGQSVAYDGKVATVVEVYGHTVKVLLEDGTQVITTKGNVTPRTLLNEGN